MSLIYKLDKDTLSLVDNKHMAISNVQSLVIQHIHDNSVSDESTLVFSIEVAKHHAPYIEEEEFVVAIREKVDLTARGPYDITLRNIGKDKGWEDYKDSSPYRPMELPEGFRELHKG